MHLFNTIIFIADRSINAIIKNWNISHFQPQSEMSFWLIIKNSENVLSTFEQDAREVSAEPENLWSNRSSI